METNDTGRIRVGVDGSPSSIAALRYAARMGGALGHPLEVVTTWTAPPIESYLSIAWSPAQEARDVQEAAVQEALGVNSPTGLICTVMPGPAARTLIELSRTSEMLVLGSRGHGGFSGLLLGSVGAACVAHAHCPVLIVRPRETAVVG